MRKPNWQELLGDWAEKAMRTPFKWGTFDCALMAADAVEAMTGRDPAATFRGRYDCAETAAQEVAAQGFDGYEQMGDALLGEPIPFEQSAQGDISLLCIKPYGQTFAVDIGTDFLVACKTAARCPKSQMRVIKTWRIE